MHSDFNEAFNDSQHQQQQLASGCSPSHRAQQVNALIPNSSLSLSTPNLVSGLHQLQPQPEEQQAATVQNLRGRLLEAYLVPRALERSSGTSSNSADGSGSVFFSSDAIDRPPPSPSRPAFHFPATRISIAHYSPSASRLVASTSAARPSIIFTTTTNSATMSGTRSSADALERTDSAPPLPQVGELCPEPMRQQLLSTSASNGPLSQAAVSARQVVAQLQSVHELGDEEQDAKRLERGLNMLSKYVLCAQLLQ